MVINITGVISSQADKVENERMYGECYTPVMLQNALKAVTGDTVFITLDTVGGCVESAFQIFNTLRATKKRIVITAIKAHSAGTIIMLAGDERIVLNGSEALVHLPWSTLSMDVNSRILGELYDMFRKEDLRLFDFYCKQLRLNEEQRVSLWAAYESETVLTASQLLKYGFATKISNDKSVRHNVSAQKALAFTPIILNKVKNQKNTKMATLKDKLNDVLNLFKTKNASIEVEGVSIYFEGEMILIGSKLYTDEEMTIPVSEGEILHEDMIFVIGEGGEVLEIKASEEAIGEETVETLLDIVKALKKEVDKLKADNAKFKNMVTADKGAFANKGEPKLPANEFLARKEMERQFRKEVKSQMQK